MKKIVLIILIMPFIVKAYSSNAYATVLMDSDSGRIIYFSNKDSVRSVASISKIMTGIIAIESGRMNDVVKVDDTILKAYGSGIYIKVGEEIRLEELVYGLMLRSGNDAALAIAKYVGGTVDKFVLMMNEKAKEIGMNNTTFNNPSGLDQEKGNYSTAYDMALLMSYAMQNAVFRKITGTKKIVVKTNMNSYVWQNKNKLLKMYKYATGGKTGFTRIAKRTLVTSASKNGVNLVAVTLVDGDDFNDHKKLYEEAFKNYKNYKILNKDNLRIIGEDYYKDCYYYLKKSFSYSLKDDEVDKIIIKFILKKISNFKNDDEVGKVIVYLDNKEIYSDSVYIKVKKEKPNFFKRLIDKIW